MRSKRSFGSHSTAPQAIFGRKKLPQETLPSKGTQKLKGLGGLFGGKKQEGTQSAQTGKKRNPAPQPKSQPSKPAATQPKKGTQKLSFNINRGRRDNKTVFVAGGTGRLGARIVRELVNKGFNVRAGTRNVDRAQSYVDTAAAFGILPQNASQKIKIIPMDLQDEQSVAAAIGNAGKVVQAIGASEGEVLKLLTGAAAREVDGDGAINIVNAAKSVGVTQYLMVTSMGTGKFGWPAGALQLFGGILSQKRRAEKALEASGIAYTIVRPGGMERPPDSYKTTHNVTLAKRDTWFGGQVSRLQVAELIATAASNPDLAENKVLEVQAQTEAPKLALEDLIADQPNELAEPEEQQPAEQQQIQPKQQKRKQRPPQPAAKAAEKVQEAVQEAAPPQQKRGGFFSGFGKQKPAEAAQEATPETASVPSTPTPAAKQQPSANKAKADADVRAAADKKAQAEAEEKAAFRERSEKKAAELAERRQKASQKLKDAETRAVQTAQDEQNSTTKAKEDARAKSRSVAAPPSPKATTPAPPKPAAKPAPVKAQQPAAKPAQQPASAATSNGKQPQGKAAPSSNGKQAAKPAAAAAGNGKPRFAQGESTPDDIKQRKGEAQSWIKEWRSRT